MFIWVQALPAYSSDMSLGVQNGGAPVSTTGTGKVAGAASPDTGGLPGQREKIRAAVQKIQAWHTQVLAVPATAGIPNQAQIQTAFEKYDSKYDSCLSSQAAASKVCLEETSPKLQETLNAVNVIISGLSSVAVQDACSTIGKALDVAKMGLTMYTATCGALRGTCEMLCSSSAGGLTELKAATDAATPSCMPDVVMDPTAATRCSALIGQFAGLKADLLAAIAPEAVPENKKSIAGKSKLCTYSYADLILSAGAGILSIINSAKQANQCQKDSAAADPAAAAVPTDLAVKCVMEQYKATEECICYFNPRLTGCANSLEKMNSSADSSMGSAVGAARGPSGTTAGLNADAGATDVNTNGSGSDGGSGGPGAPTGGGSGIGGGGGGGDGMGRGNSGSGRSGLDANILAGTGGGGGGGGGWGSRGGAGGDKYREYLPGGKKDPKALAGQEAWAKEVTGSGSKSNWQKVRDRYIDNKSTLLGN
jgi:hypothetical protein